jgi:hypothetical protein
LAGVELGWPITVLLKRYAESLAVVGNEAAKFTYSPEAPVHRNRHQRPTPPMAA